MNITLKARMSAVLGFLILLLISIGLLGLYGMTKSDEGLKAVYENRTVALEKVSRIDRLMVQNQLALAEALEDSMVVTINIKSALIDKNVAEINQAWSQYMATNLAPEERILAEEFAAARAKMANEGLIPAMKAMHAGQLAEANEFQDRVQALAPAVRKSVDALRKIQVDAAQNEYEQSTIRYVALRSTVIISIAVGVILAAVLGFFLVGYIYRQLGGEPDYAAQIVHSIADGDLTVAVHISPADKHSLLFAMKRMQAKLAETVGEIRLSTQTIASTSYQIAASNQDLAERTDQGVSALQETARSLEKLTMTVRNNTDHANQANQLAQSASEVALKGSVAVLDVVSTMGSINNSAKKIADIISVIDGIAFQTNILALNAAVEAARAGEQGRGFAVVASEVRNLAQRSATAAKEIKELIGLSVSEVSAGSKIVAQAGATMEEIVNSVRLVTAIMGEISAASEQQHAGIQSVNQSITQMDGVTHQNAVLVGEAAESAALLENQAGILAQVVGVFKLEMDMHNDVHQNTQDNLQHSTQQHSLPVTQGARSVSPAAKLRRLPNPVQQHLVA